METVNEIADRTIGTVQEPISDRKKVKERYMHSLVQDKNELRRKRDRAAGMDRKILHIKGSKIKSNTIDNSTIHIR